MKKKVPCTYRHIEWRARHSASRVLKSQVLGRRGMAKQAGREGGKGREGAQVEDAVPARRRRKRLGLGGGGVRGGEGVGSPPLAFTAHSSAAISPDESRAGAR